MYVYQNGNTTVEIKSNGTKIRTYNDFPKPVFPESIDCKITNFCNLHNLCLFCHEQSNLEGEHADLSKTLDVLRCLPAGVEIAIGGGNPLSHPDLVPFLLELRNIGLIPNLTVNELHLKKHKTLLTKLINDKLIFGLGISFRGKMVSELKYFCNLTDNVVFHIIAGVHDITILNNILEYGNKVLVLGYKQFGKGISYYSTEVEERLYRWLIHFRNYLDLQNLELSFDNLGIKQIKPQRFLKNWDDIYMGDDGEFTMYLDAVKQEYALSSTSYNRYSYNGNIVNMFAHIRST